jgi:hypothetical protein
MVDGDGAARGREAALKVRRMKLSDRRARVAGLYPELSTTEIAAELGCAQSTIANDVIALGISAPVGPRRKYPEPKPRQCEECGVKFRPTASQVERGYGKLCSEECRRHRGGLRATTERHRRADEQLARLNADGFLTMRQAADELKCVESSLHRYVELGYLETAGRRRVEGEWWTLVRREEVERFKAEEWPAIRARHAEMRREDLERGWPVLPSTWGGRARQRHLGRANATKPPKPLAKPRGNQRVELADDEVKRIEKFADRGWGRRAIANELGIGPDVVRRVLAELRRSRTV